MKFRRIMSRAWICAVAGLFLMSCSNPPSRPSHTRILLISMDTTRADHLGCYGSSHAVNTPHLDGLAAEGVRFSAASTPVPLTLPAHCSVMTGQYPLAHGVHDNVNATLPESALTLAEIFRDQGMDTGAVIASRVLAPPFGLAQGFDVYDHEFDAPLGAEHALQRRGDEVTRKAEEFLDQHGDGSFFCFVHYYDPHTPYEPPSPFDGPDKDPYDGEIEFMDHCIGQLLDHLKLLGLDESTWIVAFGDHGEGLGEHDESEHGYFVYQSTVHVPLIIRPPGGVEPVVVDPAVSLVDLAPTLLRIAGLEVPENMAGWDLSPVWNGDEPLDGTRLCHAESLIPTIYGCNPLLALVGSERKYIESGEPELYNWKQDPGEQANLASDHPEMVEAMSRALEGFLDELARSTASDSASAAGAADLLSGLGYVGGSVDTSLEHDATRSDPREWIAYHEAHQQVVRWGHERRFDEARAACDQMLAQYPNAANTHFLLAKLAYTQGIPGEAIDHAQRYLTASTREVAPPLPLPLKRELARAHQLMAESFLELNQPERALHHFQAQLDMGLGDAELHTSMARLARDQGRAEDAMKHWQAALSFEESAEAHVRLGEHAYAQGQMDACLKHWKKALAIKPDQTDLAENVRHLERRMALDRTIGQALQSIKRNPEDVQAMVTAATACFEKGDSVSAMTWWRKAAELEPNNPNHFHALGVVAFDQGDFEAACGYWQKAWDQAPDSAEIVFRLGEAHFRAGRIAQARSLWDQALAIEPGYEPARQALSQSRNP